MALNLLNFCPEILLPIISEAANLQLASVSKYCNNIYQNNKKLHTEITIKTIRKGDLHRLSLQALDLITKDINVFNAISQTYQFADECLPLFQMRHNMTRKCYDTCKRLVNEIDSCNLTEIDMLIINYIKLEKTDEEILDFVKHQFKIKITARYWPSFRHHTRDLLTYYAYINNLKIYKLLDIQYAKSSLIDLHFFIAHQNFDAINYIINESPFLYLNSYLVNIDSIRNIAIKLHSNDVFNKYYFKNFKKDSKCRYEILTSVVTAKIYKNDYVLTKMTLDKNIVKIFKTETMYKTIDHSLKTNITDSKYSKQLPETLALLTGKFELLTNPHLIKNITERKPDPPKTYQIKKNHNQLKPSKFQQNNLSNKPKSFKKSYR